MMRNTIAIILMLLLAAPARAVVDIAPEEVGTNSGIFGSIAFANSSKSGNTDKNEFDVGGKLKYDSARSYLCFVQGTYEKTRSSGVDTENELIVHARYLHKLLGGETFYGEAFSQTYQDEFKGIDNRWLLGGNLRWRFLSTRGVGKLYVGGGVFKEELNYTAEFSEEDDSNARWNSYMAYTREFTPTVVFSAIGYYQPDVDDTADYYTAFNAELSVHVLSRLHLSVSYDLDRDSRPPEGIEKVDKEVSTALVWKF